MLPQRIGRYQVEREIGRGAMGVVLLAHDPAIGRPVAIKSVSFGAAAVGRDREEARQRFRREAQAAGRLIHPHIVTILDVGEFAPGELFIAMEYIEGPTLERFARPADLLPVERALHFVCQAAEALAFAHRHRIVHRDLKPANLMIADGDRLKITDFGLAKNPDADLTHSGTLVGTPSYMSPEQIAGKSLDGRSDLFSLGVVLYELLTGSRPFPGEQISTVIYRILHEEPADPSRANPRVPASLDALLRRALHKERDLRFQTGSEMARALRDLALAPPAPAASATLVRPAPPPRPPAAGPGAAAGRPAPRRRGLRQIGAAGIAILLMTVVLGAFVPPLRRTVQRSLAPHLLAGLPFARTGWLDLASDRPGAEFRLDGVPLDEHRLRREPALVGRVLTASDGCLRGEHRFDDPLPEGLLTVALREPVLRRVPVRSAPEGAAIGLDGRPTGLRAPATLEIPACQGHLLTLSIPGRLPAALHLPADGDWAALAGPALALAPLPDGRLRIEAPYPLQVHDAGLRIGDSSSDLSLPPGVHRLTIGSRDHRVRREVEVDLDPGELRTLKLDLPPLGHVRINAFPGNATILVDGIDAGPPPLEMDLAVGAHDVAVLWHVGRPRAARRRVTVEEGAANAPWNFRQGG